MSCIFCDISKGNIKTDPVYRDEQVMAFNDINPQAAVHVVLIPHEHIETLQDIGQEHADLLGHMMLTIPVVAGKLKIAERGYRVVFNCNKDAGQEVFHIHAHILAGRKFLWPPG